MRSRTFKRGRVVAAIAAVSVLPMLVSPAMASAGGDTAGTRTAPAAYSTDSYLASRTDNGRKSTITVYSPSMGRDIPLEVILPADTSEPRPTLYLLNGAGGGEDRATWQRQTDVMDFFNDKNVNVVTPIEGAFSYYTDWVNEDPALGVQKWQTFLTQELPPVIDAEFNTNKVQSISAISMTATSVLNLAIAAPGLYKSVGAFSGCAETSTPVGQSSIELVVGMRGDADVTNMWGPLDGQGWIDNDPVVNAEKLRGTELYVSTGSGLPGPHDTLANEAVDGQVGVLANQIIVGGIIEAAVNYCTHNLAYRLNELQIPATFDFKPTGTHSWGYWQDDLHNSWPMIANSMGV
ncbi:MULTISPECIES: alpha/beta hydrolase [Rhodococcus]|jgi:diacylglycerol O-acyltransferase/trehalose O-mycolyltransferase|uniref:alpha/beta hydrolase n=1 Tax=Rhodococcus TaxID=1827 RepID=UPI000ABFF96F|nr:MULTISPECIES: alpha/beta hydrolase family protein [Rhodococcus]QXW04485.1 esterase family protein [Rhodococcus globerulus]ROZ49529.1 esterase family protein [Rhodococcus sp. WS3]RZL21524.1 MAG: esterase family protein [Rhodococcus sp. (in: high G+C Gram-positive bacteria)]